MEDIVDVSDEGFRIGAWIKARPSDLGDDFIWGKIIKKDGDSITIEFESFIVHCEKDHFLPIH